MTRLAKTHVYPNHALEDYWRERGYDFIVLWEMKGPPRTDIAWMVAYALNGRVVIVQTYKEGGWTAYTSNDSINKQNTFDDVDQRCGIIDPRDAAPEMLKTLRTLLADLTSERTQQTIRTGPHACLIQQTIAKATQRQ